jgi:hypothetical protein
MPVRRCVLLVVLFAGLGCFKSSTFEASSESSSDSSASSSRSSTSSSGSSSPSSREGAYREDVADYTSTWIKSGGGPETFLSGIAPIAERHGITNWESDEITYEGIGRGLKDSGITGTRYTDLKQQLSGGDPLAAGWIDEGYGR